MSSSIAIKVDGLSKCYHIYETPKDRLLQLLFGKRKKFHRDFWALKSLSFEIKQGETIGFVGRNGSGKSTLLQLICGTLNPTSGSIKKQGRVAALLELGSGFNPDFSGRENVYLNATMLGLSREAIDQRFDLIASFADIGEFIDQPVKTYSSGMFVRLAFAVIAHVDADILVIDEALAVGDAIFTQKCMRFLREFQKTGTVLFVSHDTSAVLNLCNKALYLDRGKMIEIGAPKDVIAHYMADLYEAEIKTKDAGSAAVSTEEAKRKDFQTEYKDMRRDLVNSSSLRNDIEVFKFDSTSQGFGTGLAEIESVQFLDKSGTPYTWVVGGEDVVLKIRVAIHADMYSPIVGFQLKDRLGQVVFSDNTYLSNFGNPLMVYSGHKLVAKFEFRLPILPSGEYTISPAIAEGNQSKHVQHHWLHDALVLRVHASSACLGLVGVPMKDITLEVD